METKKNQNQNQGKQSTARTDASYNRDAESLKDSTTTSQNSGTSPGNVAAGGVMNEDDKGERKDMSGGGNAGKTRSQNTAD